MQTLRDGWAQFVPCQLGDLLAKRIRAASIAAPTRLRHQMLALARVELVPILPGCDRRYIIRTGGIRHGTMSGGWPEAVGSGNWFK